MVAPWLHLCSALWLVQAATLSAQDPIISEFMAANGGTLKDGDGETSDWVEIYNPASSPVSLGGWFLTDDLAQPTLWRFPNATLPGHGFLTVFASGKNRTNATAELHTSFALSRTVGAIALVKPDGTVVDSGLPAPYPVQATDVSYGRPMSTQVSSWISSNAPAKLWIPNGAAIPAGWMDPAFDDAAWQGVVLGIGYNRPEAGAPEPPEPPPALKDVTQPGDLVVATSLNSPANEGVGNAIDDSTATKYLNFDKLNAGFTVTPSVGASVVQGLKFTSANDAPDRDPTSYVLSGSNDGTTFQQIARGTVPAFSGRFTPVSVSFANQTSYRLYRLLFPTVQNAGAAVAMQIAEVEFLGFAGPQGPELSTLIRTDIEGLLYNHGASALVRVPFTLDSLPSEEGPVLLRLLYEDGFVAYLNGVEIGRANAPAAVDSSATAVTNRIQRAAATPAVLDVTPYRSALRTGKNVLAIHGLNWRADSRDFLLDATLEFQRTTLGAAGYLIQPTPGSPNGAQAGGLIAAVTATPGRGFYSTPLDVVLNCPTPGVTLVYTTNGSVPSITNGLVYTGPIRLGATTPLRAVAVRDSWRSSAVITHSYIFTRDVVQQTQTKALQAGFPANWVGATADYDMDSRVVGANGTDAYGGKYTRTIESDLKSLPSMSLVIPNADMFGPQGIYSNPLEHGSAWERATSVEWILPDGSEGFQVDAGIRIQGGAFRRFDLSLKKSFRVVFRDQYGVPRLQYPLFGPGATDRFDNFVLRANSNDAWPYGGGNAVYVRDAFAMETARAFGIPSSHGRFAHLYINGLYWGLYNPVERPDAAFAEAYLGGDKDNWDSINQDSAPDGTYDAWNRLLNQLGSNMTVDANYQKLLGNNPDGSRNPALERLLNVDNYIDYLILNFYVGNTDWPGRNWWAGRDRTGTDGFTFRPWDTETALGFSSVDTDVTGVADAVARPYAAIRRNANFRMTFADHVYRHFFNGGPLWVNPSSPAWNPALPDNNRPAARFAALAESIRSGVVGETARWGDQLRGTPFTRDEHWAKERDRLLADYFPRRSAIVIEQLKRASLYPRTDPPVMNQRGGSVPAGFQLTLTAGAGQIYYTTNGLDPRLTANRQLYSGPVTLKDLTRVRARVLNGQEWSALNEARFVVGTPVLSVSELQYHPANPSEKERAEGFTNADDFEFVELVNRGEVTMDLSGARFTQGITFQFAAGTPFLVAPGSLVLLVRNAQAFELRYGSGHAIAGAYTGRFDNAGERIVLVDASGRTALDFTYGTTPPWPVSPDGQGPSLELRDPAAPLNAPGSWRASALLGGTPGEPNSPPDLSLNYTLLGGGFLRLSFLGRVGQGYTVEVRDIASDEPWRVVQRGPAQTRTGPVDVFVNMDREVRAQYFRVTIP